MPSSGPSRHHVVFCSDRNYLPYLGVTAYSLLATNAALGLEITVIADEVDDANRQRFDMLSAEFSTPVNLHRLSRADQESLGRLKVHGRFAVANYYRLLIPQVLPDTAATALYLDADMIVDGDLAGLFGCALDGKALGACADPLARMVTRKPGYFNSGLMLMNLPRWRELDIAGKAMACAAVRNDLVFCEQDALNEVVAPEWVLWLDQEYNYMLYDRLKPALRQQLDEQMQGMGAPRILHYTGHIKPWHGWYTGAHRDRYVDCARRSPWRDAGLAQNRPANPQQEYWLGEAAEKAADFRKAAYHYKRIAAQALKRTGGADPS